MQLKASNFSRNANVTTKATKIRRQATETSQVQGRSLIRSASLGDESRSLRHSHPSPNFPPWEKIKKSEKSTRQWMLEQLGGCDDGDTKKCHVRTVPAPTHKEYKYYYYVLSDIKKWLDSNDPTIRTMGQIIYLYWFGYKGTEGIASPNNPREPRHEHMDPDGFYWDNFDLGIDQVAEYDAYGRNHCGEEIDAINWLDLLMRNEQVIARTEFFKQKWEPHDWKDYQNGRFKFEKKFLKKFSAYFKDWPKTPDGYVKNVTVAQIDRFLTERGRLGFRMDNEDINDEAYARYIKSFLINHKIGHIWVN